MLEIPSDLLSVLQAFLQGSIFPKPLGAATSISVLHVHASTPGHWACELSPFLIIPV